MKHLLLALALTGTAQAQPPADKVAHFSLSAVATAGLITTTQALHPTHNITPMNRALSTGWVLLGGYVKELHDAAKYNHSLDWGDMRANMLGTVTGQFLKFEF